MSQSTRAKHGVLGFLLGIVTFIAPGVLALVAGAFRDVLPPGWMQYPVWMSEGGARALALALGVGLLVVGKGYFSFRRIGWWAYMAWALWSAVSMGTTLGSGSAGPEVELLPLLAVLGVPYLWVRRRDFGIRLRSNAVGR